MIRAPSIRLQLLCAVAALACLGGSALAQPATKAAATSAAQARSALDPAGLSGVWFSTKFRTATSAAPSGEYATIATAEGKPVPLQPWAAKLTEERMAQLKAGRPFAHTKSRCLPAGIPKSMMPPASLPIQILVTPGQVTMLFEEFNDFRIIRMNAKHKEDPTPGFFGDSVGHWEGATLVVDSIGFNDETTLDSVGTPHSDQLHVVERYTRVGDLIEIDFTLDDPGAFTQKWNLKAALRHEPGGEIAEYYCENDRNKPDEHGVSGVQGLSR
jgi:hypothetical protein